MKRRDFLRRLGGAGMATLSTNLPILTAGEGARSFAAGTGTLVLTGRSPTRPWEAITNNVIGFAHNATGGRGGPLVHVTNLNNSGAGSLRAACEVDGTAWIVFDVSGTIDLSSNISIHSNKTIDGRGADITLTNYGLTVGRYTVSDGIAANNVIIENIQWDTTTGLGGAPMLVTENAYDVWIDHCSFTNPSDEAIYISSNGTDGLSGTPPYNVTVSWCRWDGVEIEGVTDHAILISDPTLPEDYNIITVTLHHNLYHRTYMRHPLMRNAKCHSFNNYYDQPIIGCDALTDAHFYSENDIFNKHPSGNAVMVKVYIGGTEGIGGNDPRGAENCKVVGSWFINGSSAEEVNAGSIFNPSASYSYTPATADATLQSAITAGAGWQDVPFPT